MLATASAQVCVPLGHSSLYCLHCHQNEAPLVNRNSLRKVNSFSAESLLQLSFLFPFRRPKTRCCTFAGRRLITHIPRERNLKTEKYVSRVIKTAFADLMDEIVNNKYPPPPFNCSVADAICRRKTKFLSKLQQHTDNTLLAMFCSNMAAEIAKLPL